MNTPSKITTAPRDSVLARFMLGFEGHSIPSQLADYLAAGLAGVAIYPRNFQSAGHLRELTGEIRRAAARPVLIGIDQEGGTRFSRGKPFTQWPSPAELGRIGDLALVERIARAMALELRVVGCNLNFAPMLDMHINPNSPVTTIRSYGADPTRVGEMGVAFHRGLRAGGVLSCAKHFPGHGDVAVDPHHDLPVFEGTMQRLEMQDLVPFARAIDAGIPLIMTAHILLPQIDPDYPASLSSHILKKILRGQMRFEGVIVADDLGMGAVAKKYGAGEAAVQTLAAGTDIAMLCHDWSAVAPAIAAVGEARRGKAFEEAEWNAALQRIDGVCAEAEKDTPEVSMDVIGCQEFQDLATEARSRLA